jgi:hypothetical protein
MNEKKFNQNPDKEQEEYEMRRKKSEENWRKFGHFGVTAKDHRNIGGSAPLELWDYPGKTQGEIWPIEKLAEKLKGLADMLEKAREKYKKGIDDYVTRENVKDDIKYAKKELRLAIPYLKSINKLPPEFENFKVENLPDDPK